MAPSNTASREPERRGGARPVLPWMESIPEGQLTQGGCRGAEVPWGRSKAAPVLRRSAGIETGSPDRAREVRGVRREPRRRQGGAKSRDSARLALVGTPQLGSRTMETDAELTSACVGAEVLVGTNDVSRRLHGADEQSRGQGRRVSPRKLAGTRGGC